MEKFTEHGCSFGDGNPKICVPIVGTTEKEILQHADLIISEARALERNRTDNIRMDVVEFRGDYYEDITNSEKLLELLRKLRLTFRDRLLLFTYRSEDEGGYARRDRAESMIEDIFELVLASGLVDLIDVELMAGNFLVERTAAKAHDKGIGVIMSSHDFEKTPKDEELIQRFRRMERLGGDILKIAVMPKNEMDVRRFMTLSEQVSKGKLPEGNVTHPIVTMAMGELGRETRIAGRKTGSAITFAAVGQSSAPGQLSLAEMFEALREHDGYQAQ